MNNPEIAHKIQVALEQRWEILMTSHSPYLEDAETADDTEVYMTILGILNERDTPGPLEDVPSDLFKSMI